MPQGMLAAITYRSKPKSLALISAHLLTAVPRVTMALSCGSDKPRYTESWNASGSFIYASF